MLCTGGDRQGREHDPARQALYAPPLLPGQDHYAPDPAARCVQGRVHHQAVGGRSLRLGDLEHAQLGPG
eukprot:9881636-Alexandrium_andersonii.AAC.1